MADALTGLCGCCCRAEQCEMLMVTAQPVGRAGRLLSLSNQPTKNPKPNVKPYMITFSSFFPYNAVI